MTMLICLRKDCGEDSHILEEDFDDASDTDNDSTTSDELVTSNRVKTAVVVDTQVDDSQEAMEHIHQPENESSVQHSHENRNFLEGTQLDFGSSEDDIEADVDGSEVHAQSDAQPEEFSGTYTRTQRRQLQVAIEQSLLASQPPQTVLLEDLHILLVLPAKTVHHLLQNL